MQRQHPTAVHSALSCTCGMQPVLGLRLSGSPVLLLSPLLLQAPTTAKRPALLEEPVGVAPPVEDPRTATATTGERPGSLQG